MSLAEQVARAEDEPRPTFFPVTPGGTVLCHLARNSEAAAWAALIKDAAHMPYGDKAGFQKRGYEVCRALPTTRKGKQ